MINKLKRVVKRLVPEYPGLALLSFFLSLALWYWVRFLK